MELFDSLHNVRIITRRYDFGIEKFVIDWVLRTFSVFKLETRNTGVLELRKIRISPQYSDISAVVGHVPFQSQYLMLKSQTTEYRSDIDRGSLVRRAEIRRQGFRRDGGVAEKAIPSFLCAEPPGNPKDPDEQWLRTVDARPACSHYSIIIASLGVGGRGF